MTLTNIYNLRNTFHFQDPIEIWEVGDEVSPEARQLLESLPGVVFKNTLTYDDRIDHWRGYQVKGLVTKHSSFDHYIFCDADVVFLQTPSIVQQSMEYKTTGSYMFRDFPFWQFKNLQENGSDKWSDLGYFRGRQQFIHKLLPEKSPYFFPEWNYLYDAEPPVQPVQESSAETGVVYINKQTHSDVVQTFYELNENWTDTYKYTHGDTAAFWLSFVMNNKPFSLNPEPPLWANGSPLQPYNTVPFYVQKLS